MAEQEEERIMIIPLRAAWAASRTDRTPRAIKAIKFEDGSAVVSLPED